MSHHLDTNFKHCERVQRAVSVDQTEGQCRDQHNCNGDACPLEKEFGQSNFSRSIQALAANLGQGWVVNKG